MAQVPHTFTSHDAINGRASFYENIRITGEGSTPFWDSLNISEVFDGTAKKGHDFFYREAPSSGVENAHAEGACGIPPNSYPATKLHNELQILRKKTAMTDTEIETAKRKGGQKGIQNKFEEQQLINRGSLRLDVEAGLLSANAPVPAVNEGDVRKMGGIKHYIPATAVFDLAGAPLQPLKDANKGLRYMYDRGIKAEKIVILYGGDTFEDTNDLFSSKNIYKKNPQNVELFVNKITTAYAKDVEIEVSAELAVDEFIIYVPRLINVVLHRSVKGKNATTPGCDFSAEEDIFELTLQIQDPNAIVHFKNAGRAA